MLIKAVRDFQHDAARVRAGDVLDINDHEGGELIRAGLAVNVQKEGKRSPFSSPQTDSQSGEEPSAQSSQADQVPAPSKPSSSKNGKRRGGKGAQGKLV